MGTDYLSSLKDYNMLSLKDLLEARDTYHVHLMHKENVIATAVGRYRIRKDDKWPEGFKDLEPKPASGTPEEVSKKPAAKSSRTLDNSEVRPYSWPAILVFVKEWKEEAEFGHEAGQLHPTDMIPKALYLRDGRVVPVCVIEANLDETAPLPPSNVVFPENLIGGGYPVLADVQGEEHVASIGCMVTDGHLIYALTNRHVSGEAGEPIYSILGGNKVEIGKSSKKQLTRKLFEEVYQEWPGKNVYVNLDIGLVEIEDKNKWTAQVYGTGEMGKLADEYR